MKVQEGPTPPKQPRLSEDLEIQNEHQNDSSTDTDHAPANEIILFSHSAEMLCNENESPEWNKGIMKIVKESVDPLTVRIAMETSAKNLDTMLTLQMQFEEIRKTTINIIWSEEDLSQGELSKVHSTIRFKTAKLCQQFYRVLMDMQCQLKRKIEKTGKYVRFKCKYITQYVNSLI